MGPSPGLALGLAGLPGGAGDSGKTGQKIFDRYQGGVQGLTDRSRRPYPYPYPSHR
jgi:hypothetical protein